MLENAEVEADSADVESLRRRRCQGEDPDLRTLRQGAIELARNLAWMPGERASRPLRDRGRRLARAFEPLLRALESPAPQSLSTDFRWLYDNTRLLETELANVLETFNQPQAIPQVRASGGAVVPRVEAIAEGFIEAAALQFAEIGFTTYIKAFQEVTVLKLSELRTLIPALKLVLLEQVAARGHRLLEDPIASQGVDRLVRSLRDVGQTPWKDVIEPLILFDHILRQDPAGAYARMDYESRELCRTKLANIAEHSDCSEMEVASEALALARQGAKQANHDPRVTLRNSHVGCYLLAEGLPLLARKVGFHPPIAQRVQAFLRTHPDDCYLPGIAVLTFAIMSSVVLLVTNPNSSFGLVLIAI